MTPASHGYVQCARCGTWRRPEGVARTPAREGLETLPACVESAWCSAQAGVGKGRLEADTGSPDAKRLPDDAWSGSSVP